MRWLLFPALAISTPLYAQQPLGICLPLRAERLEADSARTLVHVLLNDPRSNARASAARALAGVGDFLHHTGKTPRHALAIALSDTNDTVRVAAACSLARIGDNLALPSLEMRAAKSTPQVRSAVLWAIAQIRARTLPALLLHNATVLDGTGAPARTHTSILVRGDIIEKIAAADDIAIPAGARVIDATGLWVTPGLWDMHVHLGKAGAAALPLLVATGVTSVRDMGGDLNELNSFEVQIAAGHVTGPSIVMAGPMLEAPATLERMAQMQTDEPYFRTRVPVPAADVAQSIVDSLASLGVDFIKIRESIDVATYRAIVAAAHARGIPVAGHAPFALNPLEGVRLGVTTFEHASYPYPLDTVPAQRAELLRAFREGGTAIVPTMVAWFTNLADVDSLKKLIEDTRGAYDDRRALLPEPLIREWRGDVADKKPLSDRSMGGWCGFINRTLQDLAVMHQAGVPILPGTDLATAGVMPGWSLHDELELLVGGGVLTPAQALHSATALAARYASQERETGTIAEGKRADLLLVSADPAISISALRSLEAVVLRGEFLNTDRLAELRGNVPLSYAARINLWPRVESAGCDVRPDLRKR